MYKVKDLSYEEFKKTIYFTATKVVIPVLNIRLEKTDYFKKGKYCSECIEGTLLELYDMNFK